MHIAHNALMFIPFGFLILYNKFLINDPINGIKSLFVWFCLWYNKIQIKFEIKK